MFGVFLRNRVYSWFGNTQVLYWDTDKPLSLVLPLKHSVLAFARDERTNLVGTKKTPRLSKTNPPSTYSFMDMFSKLFYFRLFG